MSTVTDAILANAGDAHTAQAMELGAALEGGLSAPFGVGDAGTSFGPFQIHLPAHPGVSAAQAQDPGFAASYMAPAYQSAVARVDPALWQSDPERAAERAAFLAERPAQDYYVARGAGTVHAAWSAATAALNGQVVTGGTGGGSTPVGLPSPGDVLGGIAGIVDQFNPFTIGQKFVTQVGQDIIQGLFRLAVFGTLLAAGGTLIALGAWRSVSPQTRQNLTSAAATAGKAAAA